MQPAEARFVGNGRRDDAGDRGDGVSRARGEIVRPLFSSQVHLIGGVLEYAVGLELAAEIPFLGELVINLDQAEIVAGLERRAEGEPGGVKSITLREVVRRRIETQVFEHLRVDAEVAPPISDGVETLDSVLIECLHLAAGVTEE